MADRDPLDYLSAADGPEHPDPQFAERLINSLLSDLEDAPDTDAPNVEVLDLQKDASPMTSPSKKWLFPLLAAAAAVIVIVGVAIASGDSDNGVEQIETEQPTVTSPEPTALQQYCDAVQSLDSSINALVDLVGVDDAQQALDLAAQQTSVATMNDDLELAIDAVEGDIAALQESATDAAADEVAALVQAMDDLNDALATLSDNLFTSSQSADLDNAATAQDAMQGVATAAQAVRDTVTDCP